MRPPSKARPRRAGIALVEFAAVSVVFFLILFGIIEYGRLIFTRQVLLNAAREGARYAVVNATTTTLVADTQAVVQQRLAGVDRQLTGYGCQVYLMDSSGKNAGSATAAQFGQLIAVQIDADYKPLLPSLLLMNQTLHLTTKALMYSEAN